MDMRDWVGALKERKEQAGDPPPASSSRSQGPERPDLNAPNMRTPSTPGQYNFAEDQASRDWEARMSGDSGIVQESLKRAKLEQVGQPGFWQNPASVVRWHNALVAGNEAPDWLQGHEEDVGLVYRYMEARNENAPPQEWKFLNIDDPMVGSLNALPTPPSEMMTRRERDVFAAPDAVKAGTAMWSDMAPDVREGVLSDPDFYKSGITEYSMANQQAILADPNFDWDQLPASQKAYYGLSSNPAGMGAVQGGLMGLAGGGVPGSAIGGTLGAALGAFAGWSGYDQTKEAWEQGDDVFTMDMDQFKDFGKGAFGWLNFLAEQAEKTAGMGLQMIDAAQDPTLALSDVMTKEGWHAGSVAFETLAPAIAEVGRDWSFESLKDFDWSDAARLAASPAYMAFKLGDMVLHPEKYKGEEIILGASAPVGLEQDFQGRIADARKRIEGGEDYREVMTEFQNGIMAQIGDMAGQAIADPLNVMPRVQAETVSRIAGATGHDVAAGAFKGQRDVLQGVAAYRADITTGRVPDGFKYNELNVMERFLGGVHVDEAGIPTIRAGMAVNKGLMDTVTPASKIAATRDYFMTMTPEARARTGLGLASENIGAMMTMFDNAEDFTAFFDRVAGGDLDVAREMGAKFAESPEFYTVLPGMKGYDIESQLALWRSTEPARGRMMQIAEALEMNVFDLRNELGKAGGAERLFTRLKQVQGEGVSALLSDAIKAGELGVEQLNKLGDIFNGKSGAPLNYAEWSAVTNNAITNHFSEWSVKHFDLGPDNTLHRLAHTLKKAQSVLLLGFNPAYAMNNGINNMVTRVATGNFGYMMPKHIDAFIARLGIEPTRMSEGVGMFGDALIQAEAGSPNALIADAGRASGMLAKADGVLRAVGDKTGLFQKLSSTFEAVESKQGYAIGIKRAWSNIWQEGKGFRRMPKSLADAMDRQVPGSSQIFREAVAAGMNIGEIEKAVGRGERAIRARNLVDEVARDMGGDPVQAATMLGDLGLMDALDAYLKGAKDERGVKAAFETVRRRAQDQVDVKLADEYRQKVEHTANRLQSEGHKAFIEIYADSQIEILERWLEQYGEYGDVFQDVYALEDRPDLQHALLSDAYGRSNRDWKRTNSSIYGTYEAMVKGMGLENMPEARSLLAKMADVHEAWRDAFDYRKSEHDGAGKPSERVSLQNEMKGQDSRAKVDALFEETFAKVADVEKEIGREISALIESKYGVEAGDTARSMWVEMAEFRTEMVKTLQEKRAAFREMPMRERRVAKAAFYRDEYPELIKSLQHRKVASAIDLDRVISGRRGDPADTGGAGGGDPSPVGPVPDAPVDGGSGGGVRDMPNAPDASPDGVIGRNSPDIDRVAEYFDDSPSPEQLAAEQGVFEIANEYGLASALADGSVDAGAQAHILAIVNKYGDLGDAKVIADLQPQQVRDAFEARKMVQSEQMPVREFNTPEQNAAYDETRAVVDALRDEATVELTKRVSEDLPEPDADATRVSDEAVESIATTEANPLTEKILDTHLADLPEGMRDGLIYKFHEMRDLVSGGEPGRRLFDDGKFSGTTASSYPEWYGTLRQNKNMVLFALDALKHGQDRPDIKLYQNLKTLALDDLLGDPVMVENFKWATAFGVEDAIISNLSLEMDKLQVRLDGIDIHNPFALEQLPSNDIVRLMGDMPDEMMEMPSQYGGTMADQVNRLFELATVKEQDIRNTHAVAKQTADAQAHSVEVQQFRDMVMSREILREQAVEKFGMSSDQADAAMAVWDGVADYWARETGRPKGEFYESTLKVDPAEAGGLEQGQKAGVSFDVDGRAVLHAFESADISSFMHESGHVFRRLLNADDLKVAEDWAGVEPADAGGAGDGKWSVEAEEKFARGFEKYLADGEAPTPALVKVFESFKTWMMDIYKRVVGSPIDIEITPEMKQVFDGLLVEEQSYNANKQGQVDMFGKGEDTPLFSGTPQRVEGEAFAPKPEKKQETMFDMRPKMEGAVEGGDASGAGPLLATVDDGKLKDFGEKLGGARKDLAAIERNLSDVEIEKMPLSKLWAKKDITAIEDVGLAAFATALRAEIPSKPRKSYKVKRWVENVKAIQELMRHATENGVDATLDRATNHKLRGFVEKVNLMNEIPREHWGRIGDVRNYPNASRYVDGKPEPSSYAYAKVDGKRIEAPNVAELIVKVNDAIGSKPTAKTMKFDMRVRRNDGKVFLNRKGDPLYRPLREFDSTAEARKYIRESYDDLVSAWEDVKKSDNIKETDVRRPDNKPRVGADHRQGMDATPEMFMDAFGFRGVEFGNWVSQGKNIKERTGMLNGAYDALFDLSEILGVPTRALSLDGELGLGLGSRGSGKASAHYEQGKVVINLTKTRGAGSLGHEWFHALDNYFRKKRDGSTGLMTEEPQTMYRHETRGTLTKSRFENMQERMAARGRPVDVSEWTKIEGVRPEMEEKFTALVEALDESPMRKRAKLIDKGQSGYWGSVIERAARSFESYVIHKMMQEGYHNDYLANVASIDEFESLGRDPGRYPYLLDEELAPVAEAFDDLFGTMENRETSSGIELYQDADPRFVDALTEMREGVSGYDPESPNILFQDADPRMPTGGYENAAGVVFDGEIMEEGWAKYVDDLLGGMEESAIGRVNDFTTKDTKGHEGSAIGFDDATQRELNRYMNQVKGDMATSKLASVRFGEGLRDQAMLNYSRKYGFDRSMELVFPYQFWYTRSMMNWGMRALTKPAWFANYARLQQMQNRYENNLPERLRGKIQISAPWMPEWMGQNLYVDPMKQLFPFANFTTPLDQMKRDNNYQVVEAERILQEWVADGRMQDGVARDAAVNRSGEVWEQAMSESAVRREAEISNPLDFIGAMFGPAWYLTTPAMAMGLGKDGPDAIGETPMLKTARAFETVTRDTWAEPVGKMIGLMGKPEQMIRDHFEIPTYGEYGEYYQKRQVANMVADGLITPEEAQMAMVEQKGDVWAEAGQRVDMEMAMRVPLAGTAYAGLHEGVGAAIQALPASLLGSGLLPAGELEYRGMKDEWDAAWKMYDAGDTEAITDFFDANPEYESYLAKGKSGDEQLRSFLVGQIWDGYMGLDKTHRKQAGAELPPLFKQAFLDSETRSYESIPMDQLAGWAQTLGKMTPETAAGVDATTATHLQDAMQSPESEINWYSLDVTDVTDLYNEEKAEKFPFYYAQQSLYYSLPKSERSAYLRKNPELREYWDWKHTWTDAYPEYKDWFNGDVYKTIDTSSWSPTLLFYVQDYAMTGQDLPDGAMKLLNQMWVREGQPYGTLEGWVSGSVAPSVLNGMR